MEQSESCIFCRIVTGSSPAHIEYEDNSVMVYWDINPNAPIHLLVISKKHIPTIDAAQDIDGDLLGKMLLTAKEIGRRKGLVDDGYRVVANVGANAHQVVDHLHFHILAGADLGPMTTAKSAN